jgi:hypothetical protein
MVTKKPAAKTAPSREEVIEVTFARAIAQRGVLVSKLVPEVRRAFAKRKKVEPAPADVKAAIDTLVKQKRLTLFAGRMLFKPRLVETKESPRLEELREAKKREEQLCFFPLAEGAGAFAAVLDAVTKSFDVVKKTKASCSFRWVYTPKDASPTFALRLGTPAEFKAALPKQRGRVATAYAVLTFHDLFEVLDDANGLIEAQSVIQRVTKGPFFNAWNGKRIDL